MSKTQLNKTIRQVWEAKATGTLLVTIPKDLNISAGDFVKVEKVTI